MCLLTMTGGCTTKWEVVEATPATVLRHTGGGDYLVTRRNGSQVELSDPVIERDSVIGIEKADPTGPDSRVRRAIAVSEVRSIAVRVPDRTATTAWVTVGVVFVLLGGVIALLFAGLDT